MNNIETLTDTDLTKMVRENANSEAMSALIDRHSGICHTIYNKYFKNNTTSIARDVEDDKNLLIYQAAKTFDSSFGARFSTWLGNVVTYACLNACGRYKKEIDMDNKVLSYLTDQQLNEDATYSLNDKEFLASIKRAIDLSSDEAAKGVLKMRYFDEGGKVKTFKEISEHFGVSTQTVINWHNKIIEFLKNKLKSQTYLDMIE